MKIMSDLSYAAEEYSQMPSIQLKLKQKKIWSSFSKFAYKRQIKTKKKK